MNAFTRGNLASVERELRKCIGNLKVPVSHECTLHEAAVRTQYALREAEHALELLENAVKLEDMTAGAAE
jgi:hypothetical protein